MTIIIVREPEEITREFRGVIECCHFCTKNTSYWHEESNTPVCQICAKTHTIEKKYK